MIDQKINASNSTFDVDNFLFRRSSFVRSNGSPVARIYERLTKASRRRIHTMMDGWSNAEQEEAYRQGVYDAFTALREEVRD